MSESTEYATCGEHSLPGAIWRPGDPVKHLGPLPGMDIPFWSPLFQTRCGLGSDEGNWTHVDPGMNDDFWCPGCLTQGGIGHVVHDWTDDDDV